MKTVKLLLKIAETIHFSRSLFQVWEVLNYIVFIKFAHVILPKIRKTIIDCQLNSRFLENCLKTQLVGFG
jgi:hypothetical protein